MAHSKVPGLENVQFTRGWIIEGTFGLDEYKNGTKEIRLKGLDSQRLKEKSKRLRADLATAAWPS